MPSSDINILNSKIYLSDSLSIGKNYHNETFFYVTNKKIGLIVWQ